MIDVLIILIFMLVGMFIGIPIAFCMGFAGIIGMTTIIGPAATTGLVGQVIHNSCFNYELSVVPLYIALGVLVSKAEISDKLFNAAGAFIGHIRGGLCMAAIVACGAFAAISGSSLATAATISKASMPSLRRFKYADSLSTGALAAGGTLGILIPPSLVLILYGIMVEKDIGDLFIAGVVPGALGVLGYMITIGIITWIKPELGPPGPKFSWHEKGKSLFQIIDIVSLFLLIIGGIYTGIFAPTEAAGIGIVIGTILVAIRGKLNGKMLVDVMVQTGKTSAMLMIIFIGAQLFTEYINYSGVTDYIQELVTAYDLSGRQVILMFLMICLILGMFLEALSIILLMVPIAAPILIHLNVDLVWFGILLVVATEISEVTPPVGMNLFVMRSVNQDVPFSAIVKGVWPFIVADFFRLTLLILFPVLSLVLLG